MKNATPKKSEAELSILIHALAKTIYATDIILLISQSIPPFISTNSLAYQSLRNTFLEQLEILNMYLKICSSKNMSEQKVFFSTLLFSQLQDQNTVSFLINNISEVKNQIIEVIKQIDQKTVRLEIKKIKAENKNGLRDLEKIVKELQTFSNDTMAQRVGIELLLVGKNLSDINNYTILSEKELKLLEILLEKGAVIGKKLKEVDRDEANLQKIKRNLNKKVTDTFGYKYKLIPDGGYFINDLYKIVKKT